MLAAFTLVHVLRDAPAGRTGEHTAQKAPEALTAPSSDDIGEQAMRALRALGGPGTITLDHPGTIATPIVLARGQALRLGPGTWSVTARPGIILDDASAIEGAGVFRTQLVLEGSQEGAMITSAGFDALSGRPEAEVLRRPAVHPDLQQSAGGIKGATIRSLRLTGNGPTAHGQSSGIKIYGYWWTIQDVLIDQFGGDGLYSEWIVGTGKLAPHDAPEAWLVNVKILDNGGNGWTDRGPHDAVATNLMVANCRGWGIDVQHAEGHFSGGGLMLTAAHLYGNHGGGLQTARGANIHAYGLESESNFGPGLLLRSNDNIVQGEFYANTTFGLQIGDKAGWAAFNAVHLQSHNNHLAQVAWINSGDGNMVTGAIYAMGGQKGVEGKPSERDGFVVTAGGEPTAVNRPGGFVFNPAGACCGASSTQGTRLQGSLRATEKRSR